MGTITLKCPNCGGELVFDPALQKYRCDYCGSVFTQEELDERSGTGDKARGAGQAAGDKTRGADQASGREKEEKAGRKEQEAVVYDCPSCGAQIVTTDTTAATFCYYCHNPVVLEGRLSGDFLPDNVIPFQIDKKQAQEKLKDFIRKKRFVPRAFYEDKQVKLMTGVYYPYWAYDSDVEGELEAEATKVHVMRTGDEEITETSVYEVGRSGRVSLRNMTRNALKKNHRELVENVQPYRLEDLQKFQLGYLSGFQAEKRDMEKETFDGELKKEAAGYGETALKDSVSGYTTVTVRHSEMKTVKERWRYILLPVWVMTYKAGDKVYYYALNGQTGQAAGKLPVDYPKLGLFSGALALIVAVIALIGGYFL